MADRKFKSIFEVVSGPMDGQRFELDLQSFSVGREELIGIKLPHDRDIRKFAHLLIWSTFDGKWYVWNKTRKPVYVDGARVKVVREIHPGQVIKVGNSELMIKHLSPLFGEAGGPVEQGRG